MFGSSARANEIDVKEVWALEEAKTLEQRLAKNPKAVTIDELKPWTIQLQGIKGFEQIHTPIPLPKFERPPATCFQVGKFYYISTSTPEGIAVRKRNEKNLQDYQSEIQKIIDALPQVKSVR